MAAGAVSGARCQSIASSAQGGVVGNAQQPHFEVPDRDTLLVLPVDICHNV